METKIKSLEDLKNIFLTNPLLGLSKNDVTKDVQERFEQIAKCLFEDFIICCGEKIFRFAELEFYYYKFGEWNEGWNKETYPRNNKHAGDLFFHYSGVDLCFESHIKDKDAEYGGILIRSLLDGNNILAGPSYCENIMLNSCLESLPKLDLGEHKNYTLKPTKRYNIKWKKYSYELEFRTCKCDQQNSMKLNLCYYAHAFEGNELDWDNTCVRKDWDKKLEKFKSVKRKYLQERNF